MSVVNINKESVSSGWNAGNGTVGTTAQALASAWPVNKHVVIRASSANASTITVGTSGNAANGFVLAAGEQTPPIYVDDLSKIDVVGGAADQDYSWISN